MYWICFNDIMDYILILFAYISAIIGVIGAVVPALPGPPVSYLGLLALAFCDNDELSATTLAIAGVLATVITIIDYIAPLWFTKRAGGSTAAMWGATIGLIIGLFFNIIGVIVGPFLGAFIGELIMETPPGKALKVACINFLAFIFTTGIKLIYSIALMVMIFIEGWRLLWN